MKKLLTALLTMVLVPISVSAKDLVKVYIFESGGCPACEAEMEYLTKLDGYNKTFEIVEKELYVDHVSWVPGEDYILGLKVEKAFQDNGFENASSSGTPFVVISDVYAATAYSDTLEEVINDVAKKGDKDVVQCISEGKDGCLKGYVDADAQADAEARQETYLEYLENQDSTSSSENASTYKDYSSSKVSTVAILILAGVICVVVALMYVGYKLVNKESKNNKKDTKTKGNK